MGEDLDTAYAQKNGDINSPWHFVFHCQVFLCFSEKLCWSNFTASSRLPQQICHTRNEWWVSVDCYNVIVICEFVNCECAIKVPLALRLKWHLFPRYVGVKRQLSFQGIVSCPLSHSNNKLDIIISLLLLTIITMKLWIYENHSVNFFFTAAKVASMAAMIFFHIIVTTILEH